ncbi:MAG: endonuclease domain-containing protein [Saprospiraceae bacterium]
MKQSIKKTILNEGADSLIFENARKLRENMTEAEKLLWEELRLKKMDGYKFRRQHPLGIHILDFYCFKKKLGIELDGGYHETKTQQEADNLRTDILAKQNIKIIRFKNEEVIIKIKEHLNQPST